MKSSNFWARAIAFAAVAILGTGAAFAQATSGNIYGHVTDQSGAALPGVTVTLSGVSAPQVQVTNAQGDFRFLGLAPATYDVKAELEGFSTVDYPSIVVNLARNTSIEMKLQSAVEETITVTAESPVLDQRKISTGATVSKTELEKIPTARDPWVIIQTTPGVLVDRINVGGNESGQQSTYVGHGDAGGNSTWSVDGVEITDAAALGSLPSYFDFDAFEEMQVSTGGSDATQRTGGVGINLVTKRGTNEWRGSGRYLTDKDSWQSSFSPSASDFASAGPWDNNHAQAKFSQGNQIVQVKDYGAEVGGPVWKDRLWIWGSYGKQKIQLLTVAGAHDNTDLETKNAKLNAQIIASNSATVFYSNNDKVKIGRNASPTRTQPTTWDQGADRADPNVFGFLNKRPTVFKVEDTQIFGSNFYLTGMYAESDGGFFLHPEGGFSNGRSRLELANLTWFNTYVSVDGQRPQDQYRVDGSYFMSTGNISHELKFGVGDRKAQVNSVSTWPNGGYDLTFNGSILYKYGISNGVSNWDAKYQNAYLQDTMSIGNLTANIGVRYDIQTGDMQSASIPAVPGFQNYLPGYSFAGLHGSGFDKWKNFTPHLGLTYALGPEKRTLLRASYSRFASQIGPTEILQLNPLYPAPYVYTYPDGSLYGHSGNWNPNNPSQLIVSNAIAHNLSAPLSDEVNLSVEHALMPEFVVGFDLTYRKNHNMEELVPLVFNGDPFSAANVNSVGRPATRDDFVVANTYQVTLPDGSHTTVQSYGLRSGLESRGGTLLRNNSDLGQTYEGAALTFDKRLSNRWMLRGNFSYNNWKWDVPNSAIIDPTEPGNVAGAYAGGAKDGDQVVVCSGGSGAKTGVCLSSKWSYSLSGLYQVMPDRAWGFNVAASLNGHAGFAAPYSITGRRGGFTTSSKVTMLAVNRPDDQSLDNVNVLNLRLEKEFRFNRFGMTLGADVFNALNSSTVLQRSLKVAYTSTTDTNPSHATDKPNNGDFVQEVLSPRIFRLGVALSFN